MKKKKPLIKDIDHQFSNVLHTPIKHQSSKEFSLYSTHNGLTTKSLSKAQKDSDFYKNILYRITDTVTNKSHIISGNTVHVNKGKVKQRIKNRLSSKNLKNKSTFNELIIQTQPNINNSINKEPKKEEVKIIDTSKYNNNSTSNCKLPKNEDINGKISKLKEIMVTSINVNDIRKRHSYLISNLKGSDNHVQFNISNNKDYPSFITHTDAKLHNSHKSVFAELAKRKNSVNIPNLKLLKAHHSNVNIHHNQSNDNNEEEKKNLNYMVDKLKDNLMNKSKDKKHEGLGKEDSFINKMNKRNNSKSEGKKKSENKKNNNNKLSSSKEEEDNPSKTSYLIHEKKKKTWFCCIPVR